MVSRRVALFRPFDSGMRPPLRMTLAEEKFFGAEFFDGVAEFGGFFEFEFLGGFAHVGFEFGDVDVEFLLGGEVGHAFGFVGEVGVVGFEDAGEAHFEGADDGLGVMPFSSL